MIRPVAIVVDPVQRVRRSVLNLLGRLGFEVYGVRGIAQAVVALGGSQHVALLLISADPPASEASDLLPLLSDLRAASTAHVVLATRAPQSVFAAALAKRGVKVLTDPIAHQEMRSLARLARGAVGAPADLLRARSERLRDRSAELSTQAKALVERASTLVAQVNKARHGYAENEADRAESSRR